MQASHEVVVAACLPTGHSAHEVEPWLTANFANGQLAHVLLPLTLLLFPAAHKLQTVSPSRLENLPSVQSEQTDAPEIEEYFPKEHCVQFTCPVELVKDPDAQTSHFSLPVCETEEPIGQGTQTDAPSRWLICPTCALTTQSGLGGSSEPSFWAVCADSLCHNTCECSCRAVNT